MDQRQRQLELNYYDASKPGSLGGVAPLASNARVRRGDAKAWAVTQDTYTLHKPYRRRFARNRIYVSEIDQQHQIDLVDMQQLAQYNDGVKHLLVCIDILSKYVWVEPLKTKAGPSVRVALERIFAGGRVPKRIQSDRGTEFLNPHVQTLLRERGISYFVSTNETKCAVVERVNRTLKSRLFRYLTHKQTNRYINVLSQLVDSYNHTYHRSIKMAPASVTKRTQNVAWQNLYGRAPADLVRLARDATEPKLAVGDLVRISKAKHVFEKGYRPNYTDELFRVRAVLHRVPVVYRIEDFNGESIQGTFYEFELQKVDKDLDATTWLIERVIRKRKNRKTGIQEVFVKWKGWTDRWNSWIPASSLQDYGGEN
jgi:transposase InsO family protein